MKFITVIAVFVLASIGSLAGCATPTEIEIAGSEERKTTLLEATLMNGRDERCYTIMTFEIWCSERTREVTPVASPPP